MAPKEYTVSKVLNVKLAGKDLSYLVSWEGYGPQAATWEPVQNLSNAREAIDKFHTDAKKSPVKKVVKTAKKTVKKEKTEEWEIDSIVAHKTLKGKTTYKIRWEGFAEEEDTWEPEASLVDSAPILLKAYQDANDVAAAPVKGAKKAKKSPSKKVSPKKSPLKEANEVKELPKSPASPKKRVVEEADSPSKKTRAE